MDLGKSTIVRTPVLSLDANKYECCRHFAESTGLIITFFTLTNNIASHTSLRHLLVSKMGWHHNILKTHHQ